MIPILRSTNQRALAELLDRRAGRNAELERTVAEIIARVRTRGDAALLNYARRFDRLSGPIEVPRAEMRAAAKAVPTAVKRAIRAAAAHIRHVAARQVPRPWTTSPVAGVRISQRV